MLSFLKMMLTPEFFFSILRISAPILFATLGAIVVEKAGFCNIGLEGIMMFAALTGSLVSYYAGSWFWGLLAALAMGTLMGLMMGFFAFQLKTDITLVGIAVNMMGSGGTLFLCKVITNLTEGKAMASSTGLITSTLCIPNITIPLLNKIPFLGGVLSGHSLLTYLAFIICGLTSVMLYKTSLGMTIRAVGENPNAAEFNILVDPEAAKIVFESGIPILMAGLDVTEKALIMPEDFERIRALGNPVSDIVAQWLEFFYKFHKSIGYEGAPMHDPCAVMALIHPEVFTIKPMHVEIETQGEYCRGCTVGDQLGLSGKAPNAQVLLDVDRKAFADRLVESMKFYGEGVK